MKYLLLFLIFFMYYACCPPCVVSKNKFCLSSDEIEILAANCTYVDSLFSTNMVLDTTEHRKFNFSSKDIYTYLYNHKVVHMWSFTECYDNSSFLAFQKQYGSPQFSSAPVDTGKEPEKHQYIFYDSKLKSHARCGCTVENDVMTGLNCIIMIPKEQRKRRRFRW